MVDHNALSVPIIAIKGKMGGERIGGRPLEHGHVQMACPL